jgi:transcriptional regulator with XRE-family HTH domain
MLYSRKREFEMTGSDLKDARERAKCTQAQAASKLGLTQAYLSMLERGLRPVTSRLVAEAQRVFKLPPTALPLETVNVPTVSESELRSDLGALGYPGFSYLRGKPKRNPAQLLFSALDYPDLDPRLVEALPWLTYTFAHMNWDWLLSNAKLHDRQNRLGFVVTLAGKLADQAADSTRAERLTGSRVLLERSRLVQEDTLCHDSMTQVERKWLRTNRPPEARHWNLLTDLEVRHLVYASA